VIPTNPHTIRIVTYQPCVALSPHHSGLHAQHIEAHDPTAQDGVDALVAPLCRPSRPTGRVIDSTVTSGTPGEPGALLLRLGAQVGS